MVTPVSSTSRVSRVGVALVSAAVALSVAACGGTSPAASRPLEVGSSLSAPSRSLPPRSVGPALRSSTAQPASTATSSTLSSSGIIPRPSGPVTPVAGPPGIFGTTSTIPATWTSPYQPSYDTIARLAQDSTFAFVGTVGSLSSDGEYYYLTIISPFHGDYRMSQIFVPKEYITVAHLTAGGIYVFFFANMADGETCIVGGPRGVFDYNPTTKIVTRIAAAPGSQVPLTETLSQLVSAVQASEPATAPVDPAQVPPPPVCDASATGVAVGS